MPPARPANASGPRCSFVVHNGSPHAVAIYPLLAMHRLCNSVPPDASMGHAPSYAGKPGPAAWTAPPAYAQAAQVLSIAEPNSAAWPAGTPVGDALATSPGLTLEGPTGASRPNTTLPCSEKHPEIKALLGGSESSLPGQPLADPATSLWSWQSSAKQAYADWRGRWPSPRRAAQAHLCQLLNPTCATQRSPRCGGLRHGKLPAQSSPLLVCRAARVGRRGR